MKVNDYRAILSEKCFKHFIIQTMGMVCIFFKDKKVGDVDYAHS